MTTVIIKSERTQPLFLFGLLAPPPAIYLNLAIELEGDLEVEIVEDIDVQVCQED